MGRDSSSNHVMCTWRLHGYRQVMNDWNTEAHVDCLQLNSAILLAQFKPWRTKFNCSPKDQHPSAVMFDEHYLHHWSFITSNNNSCIWEISGCRIPLSAGRLVQWGGQALQRDVGPASLAPRQSSPCPPLWVLVGNPPLSAGQAGLGKQLPNMAQVNASGHEICPATVIELGTWRQMFKNGKKIAGNDHLKWSFVVTCRHMTWHDLPGIDGLSLWRYIAGSIKPKPGWKGGAWATGVVPHKEFQTIDHENSSCQRLPRTAKDCQNSNAIHIKWLCFDVLCNHWQQLVPSVPQLDTRTYNDSLINT